MCFRKADCFPTSRSITISITDAGWAATQPTRPHSIAWSSCSTSAIYLTGGLAKLSGGERQRVAVGRALLMRPRLLLLDEPLASLDAARKRDILPYLERLRDEAHVPMIYVSHNAAEVKRIASRVVRLDAGAVTATGGAELLDAAQADMLA